MIIWVQQQAKLFNSITVFQEVFKELEKGGVCFRRFAVHSLWCYYNIPGVKFFITIFRHARRKSVWTETRFRTTDWYILMTASLFLLQSNLWIKKNLTSTTCVTVNEYVNKHLAGQKYQIVGQTLLFLFSFYFISFNIMGIVFRHLHSKNESWMY